METGRGTRHSAAPLGRHGLVRHDHAGSVLLPFFDRAGQLLTTRLNVTHHQAPIFALTICSFLVDSLADPFNRGFQSVDFSLEIIVDLPAARAAADEAAREAAEQAERNALLEAEQKATRDARYAARKAAKKKRRRGY